MRRADRAPLLLDADQTNGRFANLGLGESAEATAKFELVGGGMD